MDRLQVEIDEENETRTELYEERSKAKDRKKKVVVESLLVSSFWKSAIWLVFSAVRIFPSLTTITVGLTIRMKMCSAYKIILMQIKLVSVWKVLREDSFWNRDTC